MAKDLYVPVTLRGNRIEAKAQLGQTVIVTEGPETYTGPVTVTPSESEQTLLTRDKLLTDNVTVNPIPDEYVIPTGTEVISVTENGTVTADVTAKASVTVNVDVPAPTYKVEQGSFTGNGGLFVTIPCDFDPDIIYIYSPNRLDDYTVSSGGVTWAILITSIVCMVIRKTPTSNTVANGFLMPIANNRPGKVYSNGMLTVYVPGSNVYKLADDKTYNYVLVKLSE